MKKTKLLYCEGAATAAQNFGEPRLVRPIPSRSMYPSGMSMATALCLLALLGGNALSQNAKTARSFDSELVLVQHVETVGDSAKEPGIVEAPDGTLFVTGFGKLADGQTQKLPRLWKSTDHGEIWTSVNTGKVADDPTANSDVSLAVAGDGTLYLVQLEFDPKAVEGVHIIAGISSDLGVTWRWTTLTKGHFVDRPWIAVAPEGTAHVIWSDADGVHHIMSHDDGKTWSAFQALCASGGSSHLAVDPMER